MGGSGFEGASSGDAMVEISVRPLPGFDRVGNNIESAVPVSFIEALLGAEIRVPTLSGDVSLQVPAGVTTGSRLRIRGKGVASQRGSEGSVGSGDQIVTLTVAMPSQPTPELLAEVRGWGNKFDYLVRA